MTLLPTGSWSSIATFLTGQGWRWEDESQRLPIVPGEPEWVVYVHPRGRLRSIYNPAIDLRELEADGDPDVLDALRRLPHRDSFALAALLEGPGTEAILRGLTGARAIGAVSLLPAVEAVRSHPDPLLVQAATTVAAELGRAMLAEATAAVVANAGTAPLFRGQAVARRRQILRWLGVDRTAVNRAIDDTLRAAAEDPDLEVRVTSALVSARLGRPATGGPTEAQALLAHFRIAPKVPLPPPTDEASVTLHALLVPVPEPPPPSRLPPWIDSVSGRFVLRRSRLPVVLVPSVPTILGDPGRPDHPLRVSRVRAFAILAEPLPPRPWSDTLATLGELGEREGLPMRLPDEDTWEAAMRGPDGRPYAAGVYAGGACQGPWGCRADPGWEWTAEGVLRDAVGRVTVRRSPQPGERAALRVVVDLLA